MVVRMRETRMIAMGDAVRKKILLPKDMTTLIQGREYDLPPSVATDLIQHGKAEYRPGRLKTFAPKEMPCPTDPRRFDWKLFLNG